jgi:hypothetical protein
MFAYKRTAVFATTILAAAIAVAFAYAPAPADMKDVNFSKAAKFDFSASQPIVECPKIAWPYGCEWRRPVSSPNKHFSVRRRGLIAGYSNELTPRARRQIQRDRAPG